MSARRMCMVAIATILYTGQAMPAAIHDAARKLLHWMKTTTVRLASLDGSTCTIALMNLPSITCGHFCEVTFLIKSMKSVTPGPCLRRMLGVCFSQTLLG